MNVTIEMTGGLMALTKKINYVKKSMLGPLLTHHLLAPVSATNQTIGLTEAMEEHHQTFAPVAGMTDRFMHLVIGLTKEETDFLQAQGLMRRLSWFREILRECLGPLGFGQNAAIGAVHFKKGKYHLHVLCSVVSRTRVAFAFKRAHFECARLIAKFGATALGLPQSPGAQQPAEELEYQTRKNEMRQQCRPLTRSPSWAEFEEQRRTLGLQLRVFVAGGVVRGLTYRLGLETWKAKQLGPEFRIEALCQRFGLAELRASEPWIARWEQDNADWDAPCRLHWPAAVSWQQSVQKFQDLFPMRKLSRRQDGEITRLHLDNHRAAAVTLHPDGLELNHVSAQVFDTASALLRLQDPLGGPVTATGRAAFVVAVHALATEIAGSMPDATAAPVLTEAGEAPLAAARHGLAGPALEIPQQVLRPDMRVPPLSAPADALRDAPPADPLDEATPALSARPAPQPARPVAAPVPSSPDQEARDTALSRALHADLTATVAKGLRAVEDAQQKIDTIRRQRADDLPPIDPTIGDDKPKHGRD